MGRAVLHGDEREQTVPEMVLGVTRVISKIQKTHSSTENSLFLPVSFFFSPFPLFLSLPPAPANGLQEPEGERSSLGLTPGTEESPAELSGSVAPLGSPPASELSEGTSDATSVASSTAQAAEAQAAESGSSISSAPESEKEGKKSKQHLYCPTCKVTVNSLSQLEAHNTGKGIARAGDGGDGPLAALSCAVRTAPPCPVPGREADSLNERCFNPKGLVKVACKDARQCFTCAAAFGVNFSKVRCSLIVHVS